ncbi:hypothetical protein [Moorena producens]|nr:hypothetical protein [Moorena producens]
MQSLMGETTPVAGGTAVAHGGDPQDRAASPRPHWLPKTALPPQDRAASLSSPDSYIAPINTKGYIADGFPIYLF